MTSPAANRMWNPAFLDDDVVERAKNGDSSAFAELYNLYKSPVYNLCLRLTKDVQDAEDLTQEVFLQVYRKVHSFRGEAAFGSWLYRVTKNLTMMHLRRGTVNEVPLDVLELSNHPVLESVSETISYNRGDPVKRIALLRALCGLTENRRIIVFLHDVNGLTHKEVAQSLGVTASTSKSRLYQAHRKLRGTLGSSDMRIHPAIRYGNTLPTMDTGMLAKD